MEIKWLGKPTDSSFDAALSYLTLLFGNLEAKRLVKKLRKASVEHFAAKDILRAAQSQALPTEVEHVSLNLQKIKSEKEIEPVLLCRHNGHLIIADGIHRISAAWHLEEDTPIHAIVAPGKSS